MPKASEIASQMNKQAILNLLREQGPLSKADITRILKISFPAVSHNAKLLMEEGSIYEAGIADNALGRKATLLAFNAARGCLIGIDIGRKNMRVMCADISGKIAAYEALPIKQGDIIPQIIHLTHLVLTTAQNCVDDIVCMGIGIPGVHDPKTDTHHLLPYAESWDRQSLMQRLKKEFTANIFIENSVNLGAIGERWRGAAKGYDNILYVNFGVGLGSAAIVDGNLLRGQNGAFGEIGYMVLEKSELTTRFSEEGALEKLIPARRIDKAISALFKTNQCLSIKEVFEHLEKEEGVSEIRYAATYFAMALINTIAVTNPEILVISGKLGDAIFREFSSLITALIVGNVPFAPKIVCSELAGRANVLGAIALAMLHSNDEFNHFNAFK